MEADDLKSGLEEGEHGYTNTDHIIPCSPYHTPTMFADNHHTPTMFALFEAGLQRNTNGPKTPCCVALLLAWG